MSRHDRRRARRQAHTAGKPAKAPLAKHPPAKPGRPPKRIKRMFPGMRAGRVWPQRKILTRQAHGLAPMHIEFGYSDD